MITELSSTNDKYIIIEKYFFQDLNQSLKEFKEDFGIDGIFHKKDLKVYIIKSEPIDLKFEYDNICVCNLPYNTSLWQLVDMIKNRIISNKSLNDFMTYEFLSHNYNFKTTISVDGEIILHFINKMQIR